MPTNSNPYSRNRSDRQQPGAITLGKRGRLGRGAQVLLIAPAAEVSAARPGTTFRRRARSGREQSQRGSPYSITSSARASSVGGTSRPSALAVLRLIARLAPAPETRAVIVGSVRACLRRPFERPTGASW